MAGVHTVPGQGVEGLHCTIFGVVVEGVVNLIPYPVEDGLGSSVAGSFSTDYGCCQGLDWVLVTSQFAVDARYSFNESSTAISVLVDAAPGVTDT